MIIDHKLTFKQKAKERKKLISFSFINGISSSCISVNIISLFLIKAGFSTVLVTITTAFVNVATIAVLFSKHLISKHGAAQAMSISWLLKGSAAILLGLSPFVINYLHKDLAITFLLLITFLFYIFRAFGNPAMQPLFADLTNESNRGKFTSVTFLNYNFAMFVTLITFYFISKIVHGFKTFQIILLTGAAGNIICSIILARINESRYSEESSRKYNLFFIARMLGRDKNIRNFFIARGLAVTLGSLIISVSIIALKTIYNIHDSVALIYILIELTGCISIAYISKIISEFTGAKPLMIIYASGNILISLLWFLAPENLNILYFAVIFFLGGVCSTGLIMSTFHYFLLLVPQKKSVGYSLLFSVVTGFLAGIIGIGLGGGLIKLLISFDLSSIMVFKIFYLVMIILSIPIIFLMTTLKRGNSWKVSKVFNLLFSPKDMRTLYSINKIEKYGSLSDELHNVMELGYTKSDLSEKALLYYLKSPHIFVRIKALRGLSNHRLTNLPNKQLIKELEQGEYSSGYLAAVIIASNKIYEAIPQLRKTINSNDYYLKAYSAIALAKLDDEESFDKIKRMLVETDIPILLLGCSLALIIHNDEDLPVIIFYKLIRVKCPIIIKHELLYYVAKSLQVDDQYYRFIRIYQESIEEAIYWLIDLLKNKSLHYGVLEYYYNNKISKSSVLNYFTKKFNRSNVKLDSFLEAINMTSKERISDELIYLLFVLLLNNKNLS
ncbi:MAG TPA: MFS transporter [Victivallales bacterium]|nr:MFS transporter [Victivallales bacterium]